MRVCVYVSDDLRPSATIDQGVDVAQIARNLRDYVQGPCALIGVPCC
jgi:hypothetical protein